MRALPEACTGCVFYRRQGGECHRHAPSPGEEAFRFVHWPEVSPDARCGSGADVRQPGDMALIGCVDCVHWWQPGGVGVRPKYRGGKPAEWWEQSGYCTAHAPYPTTERRERVEWRVTHASDSCGDGMHIADAATDEDDLTAEAISE
jgi:hypothetical protein